MEFVLQRCIKTIDFLYYIFLLFLLFFPPFLSVFTFHVLNHGSFFSILMCIPYSPSCLLRLVFPISRQKSFTVLWSQQKSYTVLWFESRFLRLSLALILLSIARWNRPISKGCSVRLRITTFMGLVASELRNWVWEAIQRSYICTALFNPKLFAWRLCEQVI